MPKVIFEKENTSTPLKLKSIFVLAILIVGLFSLFYFYPPKDMSEKIKAEENAVLTKKTIEAVGKIMALPTDEAPTVATVLDKEKLSGQEFFKNVQNGDILLVYAKASKAILYRPSERRIIEVGPVFFNQDEKTNVNEGGEVSVSQKVKVAYYNGTKIPGLSRETLNKVAEAYPDYETGAVTNASKKDYKETIVVDLSGKHSAEANNLAKLLNCKISTLPQGETAPSADILVISGK